MIDVVVIGGGPAGMMAAGCAAKRGRSVLLLEKNAELGKKLLITGGGRCNVTNNKTDTRVMLAKYKNSGKFLFSAFSQFAVAETLKFFNDREMPMKEENEGRMFPVSNSAQSVFDVMVNFMSENNVSVQTNAEVKTISYDKNTKKFFIKLKSGEEVGASACIVATGGISRPETGSTGDGFIWLKELGHTIIENNFALVPIALREAWVKKLGGVTLPDIKLSITQDGKKHSSYTGKLLFTHFGISGPTVLQMSKTVGELLGYGEVIIELDLFPKLDPGALKERLQMILISESNKKIKNSLTSLMPTALVVPILALAKIDADTPNHSVKSADRVKLASLLKTINFRVKNLLGEDKAIVSSGGVSLTEINFKTMESNMVPSLYPIGDVLNIDRPSGGYSLQLCWTTGFVAGNHC